MTTQEATQEMLKLRKLMFTTTFPKGYNILDMWDFAYNLIENIDEKKV